MPVFSLRLTELATVEDCGKEEVRQGRANRAETPQLITEATSVSRTLQEDTSPWSVVVNLREIEKGRGTAFKNSQTLLLVRMPVAVIFDVHNARAP